RGAESWFEDRRRYAAAFAAGLKALGFDLLVKDELVRSPGVTAFKCSDAEAVRKNLRVVGIEAAGGQEAFKGKLIRVAHYNDFAWPHLAMVLGSLYTAGCAEKEKCTFLEDAWRVWHAYWRTWRA
ncbi:alanine--glyoxylate aminotransferase family protein, partial [Synergistaceae bacterium OttesenSCG-928-D05]|nr:alanine--glyoxylate aminotransferase family protein [Synergistaceae bacterium OttesenSCG-928-D05]